MTITSKQPDNHGYLAYDSSWAAAFGSPFFSRMEISGQIPPIAPQSYIIEIQFYDSVLNVILPTI